MLSEHQKKKGIKLFKLLDDDGNGVITQEDYEDGAQRLAELRNYQPDSVEYQILNSKYIGFWNSLKKVTDKDRNNQITLDEWLEYFEILLKEKEQIFLIMGYLFDLLDRDGDREITAEEYTLFLRGYYFDKRSAMEIFIKLDLNGDGHLSKEEFLQLANDFYFSDDPNAPGNALLGLD